MTGILSPKYEVRFIMSGAYCFQCFVSHNINICVSFQFRMKVFFP